uniref:TMV resistance protein N n=1 Tax=Cajanus cajan TaxID=3821 RepID=A0A151TXA6_CAJCA|nr:TMV resistance protein N [Cajanus cajan]
MSSSKKYDVFLSFRGEDTLTYIDEQLEKGDEISPALIKAIKDSHVSVVVFSENYASSKWCLGELIMILDCKKDQGQIVIPIFYDIDPSHVRKQTGSYEQAFNKWKAALTEAANLSGWDSQTYRLVTRSFTFLLFSFSYARTDPELLKDIVEDVLRKLPPRYQNQRKGLVGIEEHCEWIESLLKTGPSEVRTLGIWGMGGIGKTTLASALYDKLSHEFEGKRFVTDVWEELDMSKLQDKKSLIVLDDVTTSEQLETLINYDLLGPGSRVIVTTRNKQILGLTDEIYHVEELRSHHSLQLFCLTIFGEKQPKDGYEDLSRKVISYCKGIPLALKVLRRKSKEVWESELRKLQKIPNMEIHKVLKLSYDGLDDSQKDIFLDIACFFKRNYKDWVIGILEASGFFAASGIEVLLDKALVTISDDNRIEMHDLIQELGQEIVRQECIKDPGRRSRLWRHEEVHDVLKYNKGTDVVEGIVLDLYKLTGYLCLSSDSLSKMTNLRFLQIQGWRYNRFNVCLSNGLKSLHDKLRYLHWDRFCLEC